jgi:hypothetical protein
VEQDILISGEDVTSKYLSDEEVDSALTDLDYENSEDERVLREAESRINARKEAVYSKIFPDWEESDEEKMGSNFLGVEYKVTYTDKVSGRDTYSHYTRLS